MTASAPAWPSMSYDSLPIPAAVFELLAYLIVGAAAVLAFVTGWLSINAAVVITVLLLSYLMVLSWVRLGHGRHPVFLFLCTMMLFQGGRLIGYCLGAEPTPMRIILLGTNFDIPRYQQGITLCCVAIASICAYLPARWSYREVVLPVSPSVQRYLPYLYLVFACSWPAQFFKSYKYYEYVMAHGGYLALFLNHGAVTATVPFLVRAMSLVPFPVFITIFVLERRQRFLWVSTILYMTSTVVMLALGSRGAIVTLLFTLWWVTRIKTRKLPSIVILAALTTGLLFVGDFVRQVRAESSGFGAKFGPIRAITTEGAPLNMTEMAVKYRDHFNRYSSTYLLYELTSGFVGLDNLHYRPGQSLDLDASALLNPTLLNQGNRVASSYLGEAYIAGGIAAVVLVSLTIGVALSFVYNRCDHPAFAVLLALTLQDFLIMPRAQLLDWLTVLARNLLMLTIVWTGWMIYSFITSIRNIRDVSHRGSTLPE